MIMPSLSIRISLRIEIWPKLPSPLPLKLFLLDLNQISRRIKIIKLSKYQVLTTYPYNISILVLQLTFIE